MNKNELAAKSDEELMKLYQEGDQMAFEILFGRYSGRVFGFLYKRLSQAPLSQDLTQDVFLKLHRSRAQYIQSLAFAPWLFSITRSIWIDHLKKNKKEDSVDLAFLEKLAAAPASVPKPHDELLNHLLPNQKEAVAMKIYDDATFDEIALRLAISSENARQIVSRGLRRLKEVLSLKKDSYDNRK